MSHLRSGHPDDPLKHGMRFTKVMDYKQHVTIKITLSDTSENMYTNRYRDVIATTTIYYEHDRHTNNKLIAMAEKQRAIMLRHYGKTDKAYPTIPRLLTCQLFMYPLKPHMTGPHTATMPNIISLQADGGSPSLNSEATPPHLDDITTPCVSPTQPIASLSSFLHDFEHIHAPALAHAAKSRSAKEYDPTDYLDKHEDVFRPCSPPNLNDCDSTDELLTMVETLSQSSKQSHTPVAAHAYPSNDPIMVAGDGKPAANYGRYPSPLKRARNPAAQHSTVLGKRRSMSEDTHTNKRTFKQQHNMTQLENKIDNLLHRLRAIDIQLGMDTETDQQKQQPFAVDTILQHNDAIDAICKELEELIMSVQQHGETASLMGVLLRCVQQFRKVQRCAQAAVEQKMQRMERRMAKLEQTITEQDEHTKRMEIIHDEMVTDITDIEVQLEHATNIHGETGHVDIGLYENLVKAVTEFHSVLFTSTDSQKHKDFITHLTAEAPTDMTYKQFLQTSDITCKDDSTLLRYAKLYASLASHIVHECSEDNEYYIMAMHAHETLLHTITKTELAHARKYITVEQRKQYGMCTADIVGGLKQIKKAVEKAGVEEKDVYKVYKQIIDSGKALATQEDFNEMCEQVATLSSVLFEDTQV